MREIKFRAWTKEGQMITVGDLTMFTNGRFLVNEEIPISADHLMQFTGLKDKNGKEIYEGDIVLYSEMILSENDIAREIQQAGAVYISPRNGFIEWDNEGADFQIVMDAGDIIRGMNARGDYSIEVIGNIYENPNLLTEEK